MADQRYRVIERLEAGGMAEVFLGEATSVQGFKKRVAIKRVLPHLASHQSFIGMFLDEARLGARLSHANIVSVFDIGAADDTYFLVMEFIDGCNLKKIVEIFRSDEQDFPLKVAIYIAMEVCRGLSYAHELRDDDDNPLELVHRDVSPPNILISARGEVKVTDFGLAKARTQLERTDPGVVKGKFSYLSPEAVAGRGVDARADIFALGVCIWEMLGARRLFLGNTDYDTVQLVHDAHIPPLNGVHPDVDAQFQGILERSLSKDPDQRFGSAREFGDALAGYLFHHQMKVTSYDVANLVKATIDRRATLPPQPAIIDKMIQEELSAFTSLDSPPGLEFDPLDLSSSSSQPDGALPLDSAQFENPASWFSGDIEVESAVEDATGHRAQEEALGWLESSVEDEQNAVDLAITSPGTVQSSPKLEIERNQPGNFQQPPPPPASKKQLDTHTAKPPLTKPGTKTKRPSPIANTIAGVAIVLAIGLALYWLDVF